ncbi:ARM repeat-containing protein [Violaceomyces palustris]|uniref:ARM repeat-containing protein n=1 Tax=Violaceomyces palustris TaxID=1673888 RepID=A0ACD0NV06_9BASI|nr:ARM repeat-containing protein [Violaceomyces palustris]
MGEDTSERVLELVSKIESSQDIDKRVSALQALEVEVATSDHVVEADSITFALKTTIRNPHQALVAASLSFLPSYVSALCPHETSSAQPNHHQSHHDIRALVTGTVPTVIERLGDQKERIRESARKALVELGRAAYLTSPTSSHAHLAKGKEAETALGIFERILRDHGIGAKFARIREQSMLALSPLRTACEKFPIKPLVPVMVEHLSDADPGVREAARTSLISLFANAPAGAKADLKRELEKSNTRKQTADAILKEVLGGATPLAVLPSLSTPEAAATAPTSPKASMGVELRASTLTSSIGQGGAESEQRQHPKTLGGNEDIKPVYIASKHDLERTFTGFQPYFEGKETEHNWLNREQSIVKMRGLLKAGAHRQCGESTFASGVKTIQDGILKALASLRTTLSVHATSLIYELAVELGDDLEPCVEPFLTALMRMAGFTKKIVANATQEAASGILVNVAFKHFFLQLIWQGYQDKTVTTRIAMAEHLNTVLSTHATHRKHALETHGGLELIENCLRKGLPDQNKDVRAKTRDAFWKFHSVWTTDADALMEKLEASIKKQVMASATGPTSGELVKEVKPRAASGPARRPGGPSSAILAAKRAASMRLAAEKKERESAAAAMAAEDEAGEELSEIRQPAHVRARQPSSLRSSFTVPKSPDVKVEHGSHHASSQSPPSFQETPRPRTISSVSQQSSGSISGRVGGGEGSNLSPSLTSPRSSGLPVLRNRTASSSSSASSKSNPAAPPHSPSTTEADDTIQLVNLGDASVDLMNFSSPVKAPFLSPRDHHFVHGGRRRGLEEGVALEAHQAASSAKHLMNLLETPTKPRRAVSAVQPTLSPPQPAPPSVPGTTPRRSALPRPVSMLQRGTGPLPGQGHAISTPMKQSHARSGSVDGDSSASNITIGAAAPAAVNVPHMAVATPYGAPPIRPDGNATAAKWFLGRASRLENQASPAKSKPESLEWVSALRSGQADLRVFRRLAKLSSEFKLPAHPMPTSSTELTPGALGLSSVKGPRDGALGLNKMGEGENGYPLLGSGDEDGDGDREDFESAIEAWREKGLFDQLWMALTWHLEKGPKNEDLRTAGLILLHRLVENQYPLLVSCSKESDLLQLLFRLRREKAKGVASGCDAIMDSWTTNVDPVLGLGEIVNSLSSSSCGGNLTESEKKGAESIVTAKVKVLGLRGLGRLLMRLPRELVEDELPKAKAIVRDCFNDENVELRQAAVGVMVAANNQLHDPETLFAILAPLDKSQQDLLTYYFHKGSNGR